MVTRAQEHLSGLGHEIRVSRVAEGYTADVDGRLCLGDGRTADAPKANYAMDGTLGGTRYLISATLNATAEAFADPAEPFFECGSLDDLLRPVHLNAKFFGMTLLPSFGGFDVMKNPGIGGDLERFDSHLKSVFATEVDDVAARHTPVHRGDDERLQAGHFS